MKRQKLLFIIVIPAVILISTGVTLGLNGWFGGGGSIPEDTMTRGLVGYWGFEEGAGGMAYDASEYANNGTLNWMTTSTNAWTTGKIGGALKFDGLDDYVDAGNDASLEAGTNDWSITAWIKTDTTNRRTIISRVDADAVGYYLDVLNTGYLRGAFEGPNNNYVYRDSSVVVNDNAYHLVSVTWDFSAKTLKTFVDGNDVTTGGGALGTVTDVSSAVDCTIGKWPITAQYFNGLIDEVRIYNRALSAAEVHYHFNRGGPVAHWKMDEGSGNTVYDSTDNNNDGALVLAGSATSSAWVSGKYGSALSFDGVDDYISVPTNAIFSPPTGTISMWAKTNGLANSKYLFSTNLDELVVHRNNNTTNYSFYYDSSLACSFTGTSADGEWVFITFTFTQGGTGYCYENGVQSGSGDVSATAPTSGVTRIGDRSGGGYSWRGDIDEVRIYNYARTAEEIRLDYNAGFGAKFGYTNTGCQRDPGSCMTQGLVGYWDMEEGVGDRIADKSENGNDGTLTWMTTSTDAWAGGIVPLSGGKTGGSALSFDGGDDYVDCSALDMSTFSTTAFTIETWFKTSTITNYDRVFSAESTGANSRGPYLAMLTIGSVLRFDIQTGGAGAVDAAISTDTWYHFVGTYDGSYTRLYLDGVEKGSKDQSGYDWRLANNYFYLSRRAHVNDEHLDGLIDEVRIYNRALSAEEVRYHYNRGGPVAHWKMDEGNGTTAYDSTENNNNGTISGAAWTTGKYGSALYFDGVNDYVSVTDKDSLDFGTGNFSLEAWVKTSNSAYQFIFDKRLASGDFEGFSFTINDNGGDGVWQGKLWIDYGTTGNSVFGGIAVDDGQWHHLAATIDRSGNAIIYTDGIAGTPKKLTDSSSSITNTNNLIIGTDVWFNNANVMKGLIDDVRIYNYARTQEQIRQDYNAGLAAVLGSSGRSCSLDPASCTTEGLIAYWNFDESSGTLVKNTSDYGNSNNGTMTFMATGTPWVGGVVPMSGGKDGGTALLFDGVDDYVDCGYPANIKNNTSGSVVAWVKKSATGNINVVFATGLTTASGPYLMLRMNGYYYWDGVNPSAGYSIGDYGVNDGNWHMLVWTGTGSANNWKFYVDGIEQILVWGTGQNRGWWFSYFNGLVSPTDNFAIGILNRSSDYGPSKGLIDEVRIYNRALSAEEVRYHYNRGGPVAHWKMDEGEGGKVYDATPNNNDGIAHDITTSTAWLAGKYGSALSFDGVDDYVNAGNGASLSLPTALTIEAWVKGGEDTGGIVSRNTGTGGFSSIYSNYHYGGTSFRIGDGTSYYDFPHNFVMSDIWTHLVIIYNGSNWYAYQDGVQTATKSESFTIHTGTTYTYIGVIANTDTLSPYYFNGLIDEVRIYNYARTEEQIGQDYNFGLSTHFK